MNLDFDLLTNIITFLPYNRVEYFNYRNINQIWRNAILSYQEVLIGKRKISLSEISKDIMRFDRYKNVNSLYFPSDLSPQLFHVLMKRFEDTPSIISLKNCNWVNSDVFLGYKISNLTELNLRNCSNIGNDILRVIGKETNLKKLNLNFCQKINDKGILELKNLSNLKSLKLLECSISSTSVLDAAHLTNLTQLSLSDYDIDLEGLKQFTKLETLNLRGSVGVKIQSLNFRSLTGLSKLDLSECPTIVDEDLEWISQCKNISNLNLFNCININDIGLKSIAEISELNTLSLKNCRNFTGEGLKFLSKHSNLSYLNLSSCNQISGEPISYVYQIPNLSKLKLSRSDICDEDLYKISHITSLTKIVLNNNGKISDLGIACLIQLRSLTTLKLSGCASISDEGFKVISKIEKLYCLVISHCDISDRTLSSYIQLKQLQKLDISYCRKLTLVSLVMLSEIKSLSTVNFCGNSPNIAYLSQKNVFFRIKTDSGWHDTTGDPPSTSGLSKEVLGILNVMSDRFFNFAFSELSEFITNLQDALSIVDDSYNSQVGKYVKQLYDEKFYNPSDILLINDKLVEKSKYFNVKLLNQILSSPVDAPIRSLYIQVIQIMRSVVMYVEDKIRNEIRVFGGKRKWVSNESNRQVKKIKLYEAFLSKETPLISQEESEDLLMADDEPEDLNMVYLNMKATTLKEMIINYLSFNKILINGNAFGPGVIEIFNESDFKFP